MYFIAEIGVNHNGEVELADKLIDAAKQCGADAVKFQHFKADKLASLMTPKVEYQTRTSPASETHHEMLKKLEITTEIEQYSLKKCRALGLDFISTPYDPESAEHLLRINVDKVKVASADIVDHRIHNLLSKNTTPVVIATGMSNYQEIDEVAEIYNNFQSSLTLLHCVSAYPCSHDALNLSVITEMRERYGLDVGFSDHSIGHEAACIARTLGATVLEKHFTLDKNMHGPDHLASSTPEEFSMLIKQVRMTEKILGFPQKTIMPEEQSMHQISRKSVVAAKALIPGQIIELDDLEMRRPGNGLCGKDFYNLIGKKVLKELEPGELIAWEHVS